MSLKIINLMFEQFYKGFSTSHLGYQSIYWVSDDNNYVIFKVKGHTCYGDRMSGSGYVPTGFYLYKADWNFSKYDLRYAHLNDPNLLWHQEGRFTKASMEKVLSAIEKDKASERSE